jgi:4-hydroxybenzoate polyprenyltransferase
MDGCENEDTLPPLLDAPLSLPLVVDLDGTLLATDSLHEGLVRVVLERLPAVPGLVRALRHGRQAFKAETQSLVPLDPASLPYRADMRRLVEHEKARGRPVHLVSAADDGVVKSIASHLGMFDSAIGSADGLNLKGEAKAAYLRQRFPGGFIYAGDSAADAPVFRAATRAVLVGAAARDAAMRSGIAVAALARPPRASLRTWARLLRLHQWSKNLLVLVPLFLSQEFLKPESMVLSSLAIVVLGLIASGTYIVNDLADLAADRAHPVKRARPLAAGTIPIGQGVLASVLLVGSGLAASLWLSMPIAAIVAGYLALTLGYSLGLKRIALLDTYIIGVLLTLRVVAGMAVLEVALSPWLISFSIALFSSLALAKRHAELHRIAAVHSHRWTGRGYRNEDLPTTLAFGVGCALAALLIMLMYINIEATPVGIYRAPHWLYLMPGVLMSWLQRIWLLASRGELDDDPVVFALADPASWLHGAACAAVWVLAIGF